MQMGISMSMKKVLLIAWLAVGVATVVAAYAVTFSSQPAYARANTD
jgi:hypothetical protein